MPEGATGDVYRAAIDDVIAPLVDEVGATWMLVSAGFDGHRADPLTDLGLSAGDFADLTAELVGLVPPGRRLVFLAGGYALEALRDSTAAALAALAGERRHGRRPPGGRSGRAARAGPGWAGGRPAAGGHLPVNSSRRPPSCAAAGSGSRRSSPASAPRAPVTSPAG